MYFMMMVVGWSSAEYQVVQYVVLSCIVEELHCHLCSP